MAEDEEPHKPGSGQIVDLWAMPPGGLVDELFISEALGISVKTLRNWRSAKKGPKFKHLGAAVRYKISDITEWIDAQ